VGLTGFGAGLTGFGAGLMGAGFRAGLMGAGFTGAGFGAGLVGAGFGAGTGAGFTNGFCTGGLEAGRVGLGLGAGLTGGNQIVPEVASLFVTAFCATDLSQQVLVDLCQVYALQPTVLRQIRQHPSGLVLELVPMSFP